MKISEAQKLVKHFAEKSGKSDDPNIDKFDHVHEELIEMSRHLRYKELEDRKRIIKEKHDVFEDGIGDLLFVSLRLANQLGVDAEEAFRKASESIFKRYADKKEG
jgi:NTP pyrophosphatase (non-canonical NTP hydrolase)